MAPAGAAADFSLFDLLNVLSVVLQLEALDALHKDLTNNDLMGELRAQDKRYLERILEAQERIESKLDKMLETSPQG